MKKAAYDLGRKSVYFIVVAFYLAFIFIYAANMIINYQEDSLKDLDKLDQSLFLPRINYCFGFEEGSYGVLELEKINENVLKECFGFEGFIISFENLETRNEMPEKIAIGERSGESIRVFTKVVVVRSGEKNIESIYNLRVEI